MILFNNFVLSKTEITSRSPTAQTSSLDLLLFYAHGQLSGLDLQPTALMGEAFYICEA